MSRDETLRRLEREAAQGDARAYARWWDMQMQSLAAPGGRDGTVWDVIHRANELRPNDACPCACPCACLTCRPKETS